MASPENNLQRTVDASKLIDDFNLAQDAEYFADPERRLEFIQSMSADEFTGLAQHINARIRGYEPRDRVTAQETGGYLPLLGTPSAEDKPVAFRAGFDTIKSYLAESDDTTEEKIKGVGMAVEALIIWVHPFNDGNGRTSRFLGKFIEDGATDSEQLVAETADKNNRLRMYDSYLRVDQGNIFKGMDLMLDADEFEALRKTEMPADDGISLSIDRLLKDKSLQQKVEDKTANYKAKLEKATARIIEAA
jgi:hypothetical protein